MKFYKTTFLIILSFAFLFPSISYSTTSLKLLGSYSSSQSFNLFISGNTAYVADQSSGLLILDVSDSSNPKLLGSYSTPGFANDVFVSESTAYVASGSGGFLILNVSDTSTPSLVGSYTTSGSASTVYVSGTTAYVTKKDKGFDILDVSNPATPTLLGSYDNGGDSNDLFVTGTTAYYANGYSGLEILDVSDPISTTLMGSYKMPGSAEGVFISGTTAYIAYGYSGIATIDVSDSQSPSLLGEFNITHNSFANNVYVLGNRAYVANGNKSGLVVVDVSDPTSLSLSGQYNTSGTCYGISVSGTTAYAADWDGGLLIFEISKSAEKLPDLAVKSVKLSRRVKKGRKANIKAQVKNIGKANGASSIISFYLSDNKTKSVEGDTLLGSKKVKKIKKKKSRNAQYKWKVKDDSGKYYIKALCDSGEKISESKENNNIGASGSVKIR